VARHVTCHIYWRGAASHNESLYVFYVTLCGFLDTIRKTWRKETGETGGFCYTFCIVASRNWTLTEETVPYLSPLQKWFYKLCYIHAV
jgi:hypothetical protein